MPVVGPQAILIFLFLFDYAVYVSTESRSQLSHKGACFECLKKIALEAVTSKPISVVSILIFFFQQDVGFIT